MVRLTSLYCYALRRKIPPKDQFINLNELSTRGVPIIIPRQAIPGPKNVIVDRVEPSALILSQKLTKTVTKLLHVGFNEPAPDFITDAITMAKSSIGLKKTINDILLQYISQKINMDDVRTAESPKYVCNFLRAKQFYRMQFNPDMTETTSYMENHIKNHKLLNSWHYYNIQPSKLMEMAGYDIAKVKSIKKNRYVEYTGFIPVLSHPHLIVVKSPIRERNGYKTEYSPLSHAIRVGFGALTSHLLMKNRNENRSVGWGYVYGVDLPEPQCTYVLVVCNKSFLFVKYQLNTLQLYNDLGICNQAFFTEPQPYFSAKGIPDQQSLSNLVAFLDKVFIESR